jgi:hypothetical protein
MKKFKKEPSATVLTKEAEDNQDRPDYTGFEDLTPVGAKAREAVGKAYREAKEGSYDLSKDGPNNPRLLAVRKAAQDVIAKDREQRKPSEKTNPAGDTYKKGGKVSSASKRADGCCVKGKTRGKMM